MTLNCPWCDKQAKACPCDKVQKLPTVGPHKEATWQEVEDERAEAD